MLQDEPAAAEKFFATHSENREFAEMVATARAVVAGEEKAYGEKRGLGNSPARGTPGSGKAEPPHRQESYSYG